MGRASGVYSAGTAYLQVVPSFVNIEDAFKEQLKEMSRRVDGQMSAASAIGVRNAKRSGQQAGKDYAGAFGSEVTKDLDKAWKSIPEPDPDRVLNDWEKALGKLRGEMRQLSNEKIGISIDEKTAFKAIENFRKEAQRLQDTAPTSVGFFDARAAGDSLDNLIGKIEDAQARGRKAGEEYGGAFSDGLDRAMQKGLSAIRPVKVEADTSDAQRDLVALRGDIDALAGKKVGVEISSADAMAELRRIEEKLRELDHDDVDIRIRVEAREAAAGMKEFRQNADDSAESVRGIERAASLTMSRLQYLIALGASIGSAIVPGAAAAAGAIGFLGTAAASGAAGVGVFALGISGVANAVKALDAYSQDQVKSQNSVTEAQRAAVGATDALRQSEAALANTRRTVRQGEQDATRGVQDAVEGLARARRDEGISAREAAQAVADSQRDVTRAEVDAKAAREALNAALKAAREDVVNLTAVLDRNSVDQQKAVTEQMAALNELNALKANPRATEVELRRAKDAYDEQTVRLEELRAKRKEINDEQEKRARLGVEGDAKVIAARKQVAAADERAADARTRRDRARQAAADKAAQSADRVEDAGKRVAAAERTRDRQRAQGQYQLATAQNAVSAAARQQATALEKTGVAGGAALATLNQAMAGLTPTGQRFAKFLFGLKDEALALRAAASDPLLPGLQKAIEMLLPYLPGVSRFIGKIAAELGDMAVQAVQALGNPVWQRFFKYIDRSAVPTLQLMFETGMNVAQGLVSIYLALTPFDGNVGGGLLKLSQDFATWAERLDKSKGYQSFLEYVRENGPKVVEFLGDLGTLAIHLVKALAPMGSIALKALDLLADGLNAIPVPVLTVLGTLIGAMALGISGLGAVIRAQKFRRELGEIFGPTQRRYVEAYAAATGRNVDQMGRFRQAVGTVGGAANITRGHLRNMGTSISTTFSSRYRSLVDQYAAAAGGAAGQTGRLRGALNVAGGVAQAAGRRFTAAGGAMGVLRSGAGGLVSLFGGPWGVALAGASVAIGTLSSASADYRQKIDSLKSGLGDLAKAFKEIKENGTGAAQAQQTISDLVAENPDLQTAVIHLKEMGVNMDTLGGAAAGSRQAVNELLTQLDHEIDVTGAKWQDQSNFLFTVFSKDARATSNRLADLRQLRKAVKEHADEINKAAQAQSALNSQTDRSVAMAAIVNNNAGATQTQLAALATQWDRNQAGLTTLNQTMGNFANNADAARRRADDLTAAIQRQYGAAITANEATENWSAKLVDLREQLKSNGPRLDANSRSGLANRDALEAAAQASRDMFVEEVAAGGKLPEVTKKHNDRIAALREEARKTFGANKEAQGLITTYGEIDPSITTKYTTEGFDKVYLEAQKLKFAQTMLELGITDPAEAEGLWKRQQSTAQGLLPPSSGMGPQNQETLAQYRARTKATQHKAAGGPIVGTGTGVSDTELILGSPGEHVVTKEEVVAAGGHEAIQAWRRAILAGARIPRHAKGGPILKSGVPAYAGGGAVVPMIVNLLKTKLPTMSEAEDVIRRKQAAALAPFGVDGTPNVAGWSDEQIRNALGIVRAGQAMKVPQRALVIALATAMQESSLHNYGNLGSRNDHDSQGLFQQRPSQGWGTAAQVRDVNHASRAFYERLLQVSGWESLPLTKAAQRVQRSAYPSAYAKWEDDAVRLLQSIIGGAPAGGGGGVGWRWQIAALRKIFPNISLYSAFRPHSITASGNESWHSRDGGRAVDVTPLQKIFDYIHDAFGKLTKELIWGGDPDRNIKNGRQHRYSDSLLRAHGPFQGKPGPSPHIHWAYDEGGWLMPGARQVVNATGKPEPVLNTQQWSAVEDQNSIMRRLVSDANSVGRAGNSYHFDFANTTLDPARLQVIQQREDAMDRVGRPY